MRIEQIYTGCLAQGAYYIEDNGEAVVIDPLRETAPYIERATKDNATFKYIFETHFHADFVSGHIDLAKKTGAQIVYGPTAKPAFEAHVATDGEVFQVGDVTITAIHTPGHTMESTCYLLKDADGKSIGLFTGDTLFIGDVGRPDLAQKIEGNLTEEKLAGYLYDSLHTKIIPLRDDITIYPAHGAGSACGKNMSKETTDKLGHQKQVNYALQLMDKETFVKKVTEGLTPPPAYFPLNVMLNMQGSESIDLVLQKGLKALAPKEFEEVANETGALLLDTREGQKFAEGFVPGSINIGIDGNFAPWVGALIPDINQPVLLITERGREEEVVTRLARVGYDNTVGFLQGGLEKWKEAGKETDSIPSIGVHELGEKMNQNNAVILDIRKQSEYSAEHIIDAENIPLEDINNHMSVIRNDKTYYVHCAGGYRSMIFNSILRARGYHNLVDIRGGFKALKDTDSFSVSAQSCQISKA
ncbi:MAG: MBL fold metallo-hydrolase [Bacteroidetes bacterium]|nr:MAG: MBL fold metallo-hydrolase [Bacteroidota bacterium]